MSEKNEYILKNYNCNICNKIYSSHSSLCNHNKKFHNLSTNKLQLLSTNNNQLINISQPLLNYNLKKIYQCKYCNKEYNIQQSRWKHEQKCSNNFEKNNKVNEKIKIRELELQVAKEKKLILKQEEKILKLKLKLEKSEKIDNVTLKQLNKKLLERHNLIKNSMINSNNNIQNNIYNNTFQLIGFGKEDIVELLTMKEKKQILNAKFGCLEKLIEIVNCGTYNQFKNIIISNVKDNYVYKYDENFGQFKLATKSEALNYLVDCRVADIEIIYNELVENNKIDEKTKNLIEKFINKFYDENHKYYDIENKEYKSFKHYKINEVKILLYNNQDKITNDISLLLTATSEIYN